MNTLEREKEELDLLNYRQHQYDLIPRMLEICFNYLERFGLKFDRNKLHYEVIENNNYINPYHFSSKIIKIKLNKNDKQNFLYVSIPELIEGMFFVLKGIKYTPSLYIADSPIVIKKNSVKLYSLFQPVTIYSKESRIIILGNNIPISRLLRLYFDDEEVKDITSNVLNTKFTNESFDDGLKYLANTFNTEKDLNEVKKTINDLFFDEWTQNLYEKFYGFKEPSLYDVLKKTFDMIRNEEFYEFNDLRHKRLMFIEYLLGPIFNETANAVKNLLNGEKVEKLNINLESVTKHFYSELEGNNYYDTVNGFSGVLALKGNFKTPKGSSTLPTSVNSIHPSYYGVIDPASIANTEPGKVSALVPNQRIDLDYGIFKDASVE